MKEKSCIKITILRIILFLPLALGGVIASPQRLQQGDRMPATEYSNVINYKSDKINIRDLEGQRVILYFWGTTCAPCVKKLLMADSLQDVYKDKVRFISVTSESKEKVSKFFANRPRLKAPKQILITSDTILTQNLYLSGIHPVVWINSSGAIDFISAYPDLEPKKIDLFLSGKDARIKNVTEGKKSEYVPDFFQEDKRELLVQYSYLGRYSPDLFLQGKQEQFEGSARLAFSLASIATLYQNLYEGLKKQPGYFSKPGRTILEVKNYDDYVRPQNLSKEDRNAWSMENCFYYNLSVPLSKKDQLYNYMKTDLDRYFDMESTVTKKKVKCYVLVRTDTTDKLKTKGGVPATTLFPTTVKMVDVDTFRYIRNKPFKLFTSQIEALVENVLSLPFDSEVNYSGNVDVQFHRKALDKVTIEGIREELRKYNLDLVEKEKIMDVLILKEKSRNIQKNLF